MTLLIILGVIVAVVLFVLWRKANETDVKMADIPTVFEVLKKNGKDESWAQFCFGIQDKSVSDNAVNLQFSIENGRIGFDWFYCLSGEHLSQGEIPAIGRASRPPTLPEHKHENGSECLRTENGDSGCICARRAFGTSISGLRTRRSAWSGTASPGLRKKKNRLNNF